MLKINLNSNKVLIIDKEVWETIKHHKWFYGVGRDYVGRNISTGKQQLLHRFIMKTPKGFHTDHINGNHLDNRKSNLRICTPAENQFNSRKKIRASSKFKGVSFFKRDSCWRAYISTKGKQYHLGYFEKEIEAAKKYNQEAKRIFGNFACLNIL